MKSILLNESFLSKAPVLVTTLSKTCLPFMATIVLSVSAQASDESITNPEQAYAWRATLSASDAKVQRLALTPDHLLDSARQDLGDIKVLDSNGVELPQWIREVPVSLEEHNTVLSFSTFRSVQQGRSKTVTATEQSHSASGTSTRQTRETIAVAETYNDYVVELSAEQQALGIDRLLLQWTGVPDSQLLAVSVEAVNSVKEFGTGRKLTQKLARTGDSAEWQTLDSIPTGKRFLRITVDGERNNFQLTSVTGLYNQKRHAKTQWHEFGTLSTAKQGGENVYAFQLPKSAHARELRLVPATSNQVIRGDLYASNKGWDQKRKLVTNLQQHTLEANENIKPSTTIKLPSQFYQEWWFESDKPIGQPPTIKLGFSANELLFYANGNAPYSLVWGNIDAGAAQNTLADLITNKQQADLATTVTIGEREEAGGVERTQQESNEWMSWLLWIVLGLAVLLTARMALSLFREMSATR
ncbi:MAG: DUF3999 family protein [Pseudomonadales bacterium]